MKRNVNFTEFMHQFSHSTAKPDENRRYGSLIHAENNLKIQIDYFNTGHGISYFHKRIYSNQDICFHDDNHFACTFLLFNSGKTAFNSTCNTTKKNLYSPPQTLWRGKMYGNFDADIRYDHHQCVNQVIVLEPQMAKDLADEQNLNTVNRNLSVKIASVQTSQQLIFQQLRNVDRLQGKLRELFTESKILELVYTTFLQYPEISSSLTIDDIAKAHQAKEILLDNLQNPPTIKVLARMCSTNEFKLKKHFKQCFNNTIYGLLQEERIKLAKLLLERNDISVSEAAQMVGYQSLSHFAKVFNSYYGILPSQLKKEKNYFLF